MNPVYKKEAKILARSRQMPVMVGVFNIVLTIVGMLVLYCIGQWSVNEGTAPYKEMMSFYMLFLTIEVGLLCLFVPSVAAGSIAGERERQTLDILLASKMTVPGIIFGKLLSCISLSILLVVSSLPVLTVTLMYGGMGLTDIYQSVIYVAFLILFIGSIGVFCSCRFKKTTVASVVSYGILIFLTAGTALFVLLVSLALQLRSYSLGEASYSVGVLVYIWLLNPAMTYVTVLLRQAGDVSSLLRVLKELGAAETVTDHWVALSIIAQIILMAVLFILSVKYLNPADEKFESGRKRKKNIKKG
jgi:ABC-type transport system involved in multi-copper enzyme maturation permease subunit